MNIKAAVKGAFILALICLLFYAILLWSAQNGGLETTKGILIFFVAVALFVSPAIDKAIGLWSRIKTSKLMANATQFASTINLAIVASGLLAFLWFTIHQPTKFDIALFFNHLWQMLGS